MKMAYIFFRDCKLAKEIWSKFIPARKRRTFFSLTLKDWLKMNPGDYVCR